MRVVRLLPFEYAVRNLGRSRARLILSVVGSALVVLLVLGAAAFVRGMDQSLRATGEPNNVIILGAGSEESIERSEVNSSVAGIVSASIQGVRSLLGESYVSPEVHVQLPVKVRADQPKGPLVLVRGVTPAACLVHPAVQIVEGRLPLPGNDEVMVGQMVATKMGVPEADLMVGRSLLIDRRSFAIVGRFVAPGTVMEAEVWMPLADSRELTKRVTDSCVSMTLDPTKAEFADVAAFVRTRVDLELAATPETAYYAKLSSFFAPIRFVTWATAILVGLGGLFGGLNLMYAAFASRVRELATLQTVGFRRLAIVLGLVQESALATSIGALLASAAAVLWLDGVAVRFSMGAFGLRVDAPVVLIGFCAGCALGLLGSLPPAWRCLRLTIPVALKAI